MGGMIALEYSAAFNDTGYVKTVIALATAARASAWCISWNETQRQCIFSDPYYDDGYYYESELGHKPDSGLSAARMAALLTYRSRNSFETRFGRKLPTNKILEDAQQDGVRFPKNKDEEKWLLHNERGVPGDSSYVREPRDPESGFEHRTRIYRHTKFG